MSRTLSQLQKDLVDARCEVANWDDTIAAGKDGWFMLDDGPRSMVGWKAERRQAIAECGRIEREIIAILNAKPLPDIVTIEPGTVVCGACGGDLVEGRGCSVCGEREDG